METKQDLLKAIGSILPHTSHVHDMLSWWQEIDEQVWHGQLIPCWLQSSITPYGRAVGLYSHDSRVITLIPQLWSESREAAYAVLTHEMCHQAAHELYFHLIEAKGPRGRWTDLSHRHPIWSRAVEDWIQFEELDLFCPVWHRSSNNKWHPWIPVDDDWMEWKRVSPDDDYKGRRLMDLEESMHGPAFSYSELVDRAVHLKNLQVNF